MASLTITGRKGSNAHTFYVPATGLTKLQWDIAFAIYVLRDATFPVVKNMLTNLVVIAATFLQEALEQRFLHSNMDALTHISTGSGDCARLHEMARLWLMEYDLADWVDRVNIDIATAPTAEDLFDKYRSLMEGMGMSVTHKAGTGSWKKWVQRWKRKWSARDGMLTTQQADSRAELREKASKESPKKRFTQAKKQTRNELGIRSRNGRHSIKHIRNRTTSKPKTKLAKVPNLTPLFPPCRGQRLRRLVALHGAQITGCRM